jgi:hypothetical protein
VAAQDKKQTSKITTLAFKRLRENHAEEWESLKEQAAADLGVTYKRRKSQEEKDREALASLLSSNPVLRSELFDQVAAQISKDKDTAARETVVDGRDSDHRPSVMPRPAVEESPIQQDSPL